MGSEFTHCLTGCTLEYQSQKLRATALIFKFLPRRVYNWYFVEHQLCNIRPVVGFGSDIKRIGIILIPLQACSHGSEVSKCQFTPVSALYFRQVIRYLLIPAINISLLNGYLHEHSRYTLGYGKRIGIRILSVAV